MTSQTSRQTSGPKGEFIPGYLDDQGMPGPICIAWGGRLTRAWKKPCEDAKVSDLRFHDLRHTSAMDLRMAGAPMEVVRDAVGRSDIKMTQRYAHVGEKEISDAVNKLTVPWLGDGA
jgi:integrase